MEQKKTLWIIAAVGVFLLVVLGAALILYSPASRSTQTIAKDSKKGDSSNGWISLAPSDNTLRTRQKKVKEENFLEADNGFVPEIIPSDNTGKPLKINDLTVYAENATILSSKTKSTDNSSEVPSTIVIPAQPPITVNVENKPPIVNVTTPQPSVAQLPSPAQKDIKATVDLKVDVKDPLVVSQAVAQAGSDVPVSIYQAPPSKPQPIAPIARGKDIARSAPKVFDRRKTTPSAKTVKTAPKPEKTQFWVQVTALTSRKGADTAREVLEENKINADVFTYTDTKGQLYYRVRVGPYTTKSEAEYWQDKIAKIDNFKSISSYVASTKVEIN